MTFLQKYLAFNQGNECPENYHLWSALCLASAVISRKVYINWGQERLYCNLYVCLVGKQGLRKSTAKNVAQSIVEENFSDIPCGADVSSSQGISTWLASEECTRVFTDEKGIVTEFHPGTFFMNELKHFLGIAPQNMIEFLTDIYDKPFFKSKYKNSTSDVFPKPYLVILACETPSWILSKLKVEMISGGFARRLVPIHELNKRCAIPRPFMTVEMEKWKTECIDTLTKCRSLVGPLVWDPAAITFYDEYYMELQKRIPEDPLMEGFHSSKHTQILKVAMILTVVERQDLYLTREMIELAIGIVERIVPGIEKLYHGAGRNELAQPVERLLEFIIAKGGLVSEKEFLVAAGRDMTPYEANGVLINLLKTEQLIQLQQTLPSGLTRKVVATPEKTALLNSKPSA